MASVKIALIAFLAIVYILSPLDLIPDVIPLAGWVDDVSVGTWAWKAVKALWESSSPPPAKVDEEK